MSSEAVESDSSGGPSSESPHSPLAEPVPQENAVKEDEQVEEKPGEQPLKVNVPSPADTLEVELVEPRALPEKHQMAAETSPNERYLRFKKKLGVGSFKTVYDGIDTKTGRHIAWNAVSLKRVKLEDVEVIQQEARLLKTLSHVHIIEFHDMWVSSTDIVFVTEKASGTLKKYIEELHPVKPVMIRKWCRQILSALQYLHTQTPPIAHRDIKCDNIFIDPNGDVRIGDFGLAKAVAQRGTILGTPGYIAPELFTENYNELVDIFAFGMCVLEMVTNTSPYGDGNLTQAALLRKNMAGELPQDLALVQDPALREFITKCVSSVEVRPSAVELLKDSVLVDKETPEDEGEEKIASSPVDATAASERGSRVGSVRLVDTKLRDSQGKLASAPTSPPADGEDAKNEVKDCVIKVDFAVGNDPNVVTIALHTSLPNHKKIKITDYDIREDTPVRIVAELGELLQLPEEALECFTSAIEERIILYTSDQAAKASLHSAISSMAALFDKLGISLNYAAKFAEEGLEVGDLHMLSAAELKELIPPMGHRKRLQVFIQQNKELISKMANERQDAGRIHLLTKQVPQPPTPAAPPSANPTGAAVPNQAPLPAASPQAVPAASPQAVPAAIQAVPAAIQAVPAAIQALPAVPTNALPAPSDEEVERPSENRLSQVSGGASSTVEAPP